MCEVCQEEFDAEIRKRESKQAEEKKQERLDHPEIWLKRYGVPQRFMDCSLETFKGGEKIKEAMRLFPEHSVLLSGPTGSGKTHLAVAALRGMVQRDEIKSKSTPEWTAVDQCDALFITVPDLLLNIRSCFAKNEDEGRLVDRFATAGVLILDDLGADKVTEWTTTTLYLIIDRRYRDLMPTIITTNLSIQQIEEQYGARIASRLTDMKIIIIRLPDYRKRRP